jgi:hypothetical protein
VPAQSPVPASAVAVVTEGGGLPTRPARATPPPTPTTDLALLVRTVQPFPTRTPAPPDTPTPTVVPAYTSTPRPTPTLMRGSFPQPPMTFVPTRRPTVNPGVRGTIIPTSEAEASRFAPTPTPIDTNEPNDTPAFATQITANPIEAVINGPDDVDVYQVAVDQPNTTLVVTLTGPDPGRYKVDLIAPRGGKVGRQRIDGTVAVRAFADVGTETGTYLVYVRGAGPQMPRGPYFISADFSVLPVSPTRTPAG